MSVLNILEGLELSQKQLPRSVLYNRCSKKFRKIHKKTPVPEACNFIQKETLAQAFSCEFCEILKSTSGGSFCVSVAGIFQFIWGNAL